MWKEKILKDYDRSWIKESKDKIIDLSHNTAKEMLDHLKNKCLSLTNTEKKEFSVYVMKLHKEQDRF